MRVATADVGNGIVSLRLDVVVSTGPGGTNSGERRSVHLRGASRRRTLARIHRTRVIRQRNGDAGASGRDCQVCIGAGGQIGSGPQSPLGVLKAVCNRLKGRDRGMGRSRGHSRTGLARVGGDDGLPGEWIRRRRRRQAGSGMARNRATAPLNWVSPGQRWGRCRVGDVPSE